MELRRFSLSTYAYNSSLSRSQKCVTVSIEGTEINYEVTCQALPSFLKTACEEHVNPGEFFLKETFFFKKILVKKLIPSAFPTIIVQLFQECNSAKITLELFHLSPLTL